MPNAVITGCNSGIGHEFAKILIGDGYTVYALDVSSGDKLRSLEGPKCKIGQLDVSDIDSIRGFGDSLGNEPIDVLLNIAGVMPSIAKDDLDSLEMATMIKCFGVNAFGPFFLTQALLPNILAAPAPRRVCVTSSRVGSITDNSSGRYYSYRASKTAVNSFFKNFAVELKDKEVIVSMLHPGFTKSNLDPDDNIRKIPDAVEPVEAAEKLWKVVMSKNLDDTGKFWHREGMELPW
ncbi:uncharacterized protein HMPREF1541_08706 [Cyphellophora europaea CBS 101466]|uniref:Short-chain dehydrogenase n=1 Tax=Cyphellophora europaea (strain CBS 101466) TaxID=1220924 RepID=W2RL56_CYPE1|nr:uncharacterized protein HMPREF1541_08706 [Cyphellophora europaea CBS 101466]ETN36428.1 hypothetical protein HMPREF1541_08706 [Cyphellophora europaea CBS 101466]